MAAEWKVEAAVAVGGAQERTRQAQKEMKWCLGTENTLEDRKETLNEVKKNKNKKHTHKGSEIIAEDGKVKMQKKRKEMCEIINSDLKVQCVLFYWINVGEINYTLLMQWLCEISFWD